MKVRSNALYQHLLEANVLNGSKEAIARAKQDYRKRYKQQWKRRAAKQKEIRFCITIQQFAAIRAKAKTASLGHTAYARNVVLESINQKAMHNDTLLAVLQAISMAAIGMEKGKPTNVVYELVRNAEFMLLQYLTT